MSLFLRHALVVLVVQASQATITGTVRDRDTGQPLSGVSVTLPDLYLDAVTDAAGRYTIQGVPAGPQHLVVTSIGYAPRTLHALVPRAGALEVNLSLEARPITLPRVDVRSRSPLRDSDPERRAERWIPATAVAQHPLLAEPDGFLALSGGEVVAKPETAEGLHIRGGASDQTAWLLDGIPVFNPYHAAGVFSAWNMDALTRLDLHAASPPASLPDVLSGTVSATTRPAASRLSGRGALSTTQASVTLDGPIGRAGAGWLVSLRAGFPGVFAPGESSYLGGSTSDWLGRVEAPVLGGTAALLGYGNDNAFDAAASAGTASDLTDPRNRFDWSSRSFGATWTRAVRGATALRFRAWSASTRAGSEWSLESGGVELASERRDLGVAFDIERRASGRTRAGIRLERSHTVYAVASDSVAGWLSEDARTPVVSAFAEHDRSLGHHLSFDAGLAVAGSTGGLYPTPRFRLNWLPADRLTLSASVARSYQFVQSLRNAESVVGSLFPADLFVGTEAEGVPIGRSDTGVLAAELRPAAGWRITGQMYSRDFDGLLLMAPAEGEPFATRGFAAGTGNAHGGSVDAAVSGARFSVTGSWGWRRVRYSRSSASYTPEHGAAHSVEAGVILFPGPTSSIRLGLTGLFGRHTTPIPGTIEWESCNLLDKGCEFAGSPHYGSAVPGAVDLPGYVRLDLGVRRHWHVSTFGRDATVAVSGTVSNLFGRPNLLTWTDDPETGDRLGIEMRPRAPLVLGFDWSF